MIALNGKEVVKFITLLHIRYSHKLTTNSVIFNREDKFLWKDGVYLSERRDVVFAFSLRNLRVDSEQSSKQKPPIGVVKRPCSRPEC